MVNFLFYSPDELLVQSAWSDGFRTLLGLHSDYTYILFVLQGANVQNTQLRILPTNKSNSLFFSCICDKIQYQPYQDTMAKQKYKHT